MDKAEFAVEWCLNANDPVRLATFWADLLGYAVGQTDPPYTELLRPDGHASDLFLQQVSDAPTPGFNRWHIDLYTDNPQAEIERAIGLGATAVGDWHNKGLFQVLRDPEGNEFCICGNRPKDALSPVQALFLATAAAARTLIARPEVAAAWQQPGALGEMSVGALATHLARGAMTPLVYLAADLPEPTIGTAAEYFAAAAAMGLDTPDSDLNNAVATRAAIGAETGVTAALDELDDALVQLHERLRPLSPTQPIATIGWQMPIDDYLRTRIVELTIHADDLSAALGLPPPELPDDAWATTTDVLVGALRQHRGDRAVALGLARADRCDPNGLRLFA